MPIAFQCQQCGESFKAADALAGKKIKCRKCSAVVTIPLPRRAQPVSAAPAKKAPSPAKARPARAATEAAPPVDLLASSLDSLMPPTTPSPGLAGVAYSPPGKPAGTPKQRSKAQRSRGPGGLQLALMIGGTALLPLLYLGLYGAFSRVMPRSAPAASAPMGTKALQTLQPGQANPSAPQTPPTDPPDSE